MLVASFLIACYDRVVPQYMKLAQSDNYVTKRQSLKVYAQRRMVLPPPDLVRCPPPLFPVARRYIVRKGQL